MFAAKVFRLNRNINGSNTQGEEQTSREKLSSEATAEALPFTITQDGNSPMIHV
jgi:hypothetical protein